MFEDESAPGELFAKAEKPARRSKFFRFDPTVSSGTLLLVGQMTVACVLAYGVYTADKRTTEMEVSQIKKDASRTEAETKNNISHLLEKMDKVQAGINDMSKDIAVLKARRDPP
jgi:hypothetical protein